MARIVQEHGAVEIHITGTVQGVGFRPHVYRLASILGLSGWVINTTAGVTVRLEGPKETIASFQERLRTSPPPLATIESFTAYDVESEGFSAFFIHESKPAPDTEISIPPDISTCADCLREYRDPGDRRYGYAFTNCVNCGPRFSITRTAPYDRKNTSMHAFELCENCAQEYADPMNRRFHAEPNACPVCGPKVALTSSDGTPLDGGMETARELLKQGKILAIKGVGGYHLACDATNDDAVGLLRDRKKREAKPFALMCRDLDTVRSHCVVSTDEEHLLTSPARPIILLKRTPLGGLTDVIAPGLDALGVMLPYTPLHYGLFDVDLSVLVMTSANISDDPLILTEEDAYRQLGDLADIFVVHKREIVNRGDDSVIMLFNGGPYFIRRARGYVPQGIQLPCTIPPVFAAGGDLKSVFAYGREKKAVLSQYFGDLDNLKNVEAYLDGVRFFADFLKITPEKVVCDLHPDYVGAGYAERYAEKLGVPLIKAQHHKAHFASAMADAGLNEKVLGVVCDGTGYGDDGSIWGCEFFHGDYESIDRVASLEPFMQPRGDGAVKYPLHMAAVLLYSLWKDEKKLLQVLPESADLMPFVRAQTVNNNLSIASSSCGRLFDAAAALCGFTSKSTYEGEAAMRMEALARSSGLVLNNVVPYAFAILEDDIARLSWSFLDEMAEDKRKGAGPTMLATRFHRTFTTALNDMIEKLTARYMTQKVVFSGGTFQNRLIIDILARELPTKGIMPYFHRRVPTNDGGLALGQVMLTTAGQ